jgi:hypothetical protein
VSKCETVCPSICLLIIMIFSCRPVPRDAGADDHAGGWDANGPETGLQGRVGGPRDYGAQLGAEERRDGHDGHRRTDQRGPVPPEPKGGAVRPENRHNRITYYNPPSVFRHTAYYTTFLESNCLYIIMYT